MMNEITIEDISRLKDYQLSKLLHHLIGLEADKNDLQEFDRSVPFNITAADAGSDGCAKWNGVPPNTKWLKNNYTIFQNKATDLIPSNCAEEILETLRPKDSVRKLKAQIEKVVRAGGCYVLFTNKAIVDNGKEERIKKFREAIESAGEPNYLSFQIIIYDANSIKDWVNEYIAAVTLVQGFNGINRPDGFRTWNEWETFSKANDNVYKIDSTIENNIKLISQIDDKKSIRVTGHSGLGKTRLVLEAFRNSLSKNAVVYYDLEGNENISTIKNYIISHQDNQNGIIIIDNCDIKSHNILSNTIAHNGKIKIVTIGLDDNNSIENLKIKIERESQRDIVKEIVQNKIGLTHQVNDIQYISTISEGYPSMAIKFCDIVLKDGMSELNKIPIDEFIQKLIFGNGSENQIEFDVVRACSVFSSFGFLDDSFRDVINDDLKESLKAQMDFIRTRIYDGEITSTHFKEICNKFLNLDIIEKRGIFYIVKPTVLAINLASSWLLHTDADRIIKIIQDLKKVDLDEKFVSRLKDLDQLDKAKEIVGELWGQNSPFGSAEVLNTSWGSQLFRYVVEVNPIATAKALEYSFGKMSKDEIFQINAGRRNLVWALERLCFRRESFYIAAKILFSFAVSENETWGNNSKNQFKQLFQLFLAGTEVSLIHRLEILQWGLSKNDNDYTVIAIEAMGRALETNHFTRMGGPEKQGNNAPLSDYHPNFDEISEYWTEIIEILTKIACSDDIYSPLAMEKIAQSIRGLSRIGESELVLNSIQKIIKIKAGLWAEAINNLKMTLAFETHLPIEIINKMESLIIELSPTDLKNQLFIKVTKPEWEPYEKDDDNEYMDRPKLNAELLAKKVVTEKIDWKEYLQDLLQGEQRQGFNFGRSISELTENKEELVKEVINNLEKIPKEIQNVQLLAGIISNPAIKDIGENVIDIFINNEKLREHSFYLTRAINPSLKDIEKLFVLVDKYNFPIYYFQNFQYGRALEELSVRQILKLCEKVSNYNSDGKWTALSLLFMYVHGNNQRWVETKNFFKNLITSSNMTIGNTNNVRIEKYHWSQVVIKTLQEDNEKDFAITIAKQIIEFCSEINFDYSFDTYISNVINILFEKYFEIVWKIFGDGIIGSYITFFHLQQFIGSKNGYLTTKKNTFLNDREENYILVLEWCKKHAETAPQRIANIMPLDVNKNGTTEWHPFSKSIIDLFGSDDKVLSQLSSNMGTFGTVGSRVPYFETQKKLLKELINHPQPIVKHWAIEKLDYTEKQIKIEKLQDEQNYL